MLGKFHALKLSETLSSPPKCEETDCKHEGESALPSARKTRAPQPAVASAFTRDDKRETLREAVFL